MNFEKSKTKENLEKALQGEALAHLKYQFYRSQLSNASKQIESVLDEIVHNEKEHGKIWFKLLHDNEIPSDEENLLDAIRGETYEATQMYLKFAEIADEEGFDEISVLFRQVAEIEGHHSFVFEGILDEVESESYMSSDLLCEWKCLNCGHIVEGYYAPFECPVCKHSRKYFTKEVY